MTDQSKGNAAEAPVHGRGAAGRLPAILVSHTHWDREWYLSLEQLRPRLLRLFANLRQILEEEPEYHSFWLDGQTAPLEDYWETLGKQPAWLEEALRAGKILAGPWFTLVDEWLTGGESLIRNLFEGRRLMEHYGQDNRIGYLPDSFGHISQMPAVLAGFGIDNAFFHRGLAPGALPCKELTWLAPGGQAVLGIYLPEGYFNAQRIDVERHLAGPDAGKLETSVRKFVAQTCVGVMLLLNGVDQSLPTHALGRSVIRLNEFLTELQVSHGSLLAYVDLVNDRLAQGIELPVWQGELLHAPQLDGSLSARHEQKIANRLVENLLVFYVEPLLALLPAGGRSEYEGALRRAWRLVMQCHAHDSICGCHSDLVAADIMTRLDQARQLAEKLEEELLVELIGIRPAEQPVACPSTLVIRNPLTWQRREPVEVTVLCPPGTDPDRLVFEQDGQGIPGLVIGNDEICRWTEHYFGKVVSKVPGTRRCRVLVQPTLAGGAFGRITVGEAGSDPLPGADLCPDNRTLDNGILRVTVQADGQIELLDIASGRKVLGLNRILDEVDAGDLYEHARTAHGSPTAPAPGVAQVVENSALRGTIQVSTQIMCNGLVCPLLVRVSLTAGSRLVSLHVTLDNQATDHWLRVAANIPGSLEQLVAHTAFDLVRRGISDGEPFVHGGRIRFAGRLGQPMQWGVFAESDQGVLALVNRGLYEYTCEGPDELSISLMRFVGLIREDLTAYPATGANRQGHQSVDYAIGWWDRGARDKAVRAMYEYNLPLRSTQVFSPAPPIPAAGLSLSNPNWLLSAWKPAETGSGVVVRFWNAAEHEEEGIIEYGTGKQGAVRARLDETPTGPLPARLVAGPKEIVTVIFPARSGQ